MPTPSNSPRSRISWLAIGVVVAALFAAMASAADAPPQKDPVLFITVTKGPTTTTTTSRPTATTTSKSTTSSTNGAKSSPSTSGAKGPAGSTAPAPVVRASESQYTFTVLNKSKTDYTGLTLEYHVYNKTTTHSGGKAVVTVDDISDTVDFPKAGDDGTTKPLAAGQSVDIVSKDIPGMIKSSTSSSSSSSGASGNNGNSGGGNRNSGGGGRSSTPTPAASSPDTTMTLGTYVIVKWNGKELPDTATEDPFGVRDQYKQLQGGK